MARKKTKVEEPIFDTITEMVEAAEQVDQKFGTVTGCPKLNIREATSLTSKIVCVVNANAELIVLPFEDSEWFKVVTAAGFEGYCLKKYVAVK